MPYDVLAEIAKCEVVCANCHAIRTYTRQDWIPADAPEADAPEDAPGTESGLRQQTLF